MSLENFTFINCLYCATGFFVEALIFQSTPQPTFKIEDEVMRFVLVQCFRSPREMSVANGTRAFCSELQRCTKTRYCKNNYYCYICSMKNEDKIPLAYFITFRTYATWLHGDERLSVSRERNEFNSPKINPNKNLKNQMQELQKDESITLTREHGNIIRDATVDICNKNNWRLYSLHVRSNHVHLTIKSDEAPEKTLTKIKARATFELRKKGAFPKDKKIWSRHGSTKYIWSPESLYYTSDYTTECQGQKMAYFFSL